MRQHLLKTLLTRNGILPEPLDGEILDSVPYPLPTSTQRDNLRVLLKRRLVLIRLTRGIHDRLLDGQKLAPRRVLAAHCDALGARVDVGDFVDERDVAGGAEETPQPLRRRLLAGYQALGAEDAGGGVERAR